MTSWHSYPKIYNLGHAQVLDIFEGEFVVEEKIDGSQFSFGRFGDELKVRSKGQLLEPEAPEKMFKLAVGNVKKRFHLLPDGYTFRGEYLSKPRHNTLAYDRIPEDNIIIFDVNDGEESYLSPHLKQELAGRMGFETVPTYKLETPSRENLLALLDQNSVLGGQKIEGFVVKNYRKFGDDKKVKMAKFVSEAFKEVHKVAWRSENPSNNDITQLLIQTYRHPTRWNKAVCHLREKGLLEDSPRDIGLLIKEVADDIRAECEAEIKDVLFKHAWKKMQRGLVNGLPEWYKEKLLAKQFGEE